MSEEKLSISRRSFLRGFVAVTAAAIAPVTALDMRLPMIVGDGVHDDTLGLQAALDGKPFTCPSALVVRRDNTVFLEGGVFRLTNPIKMGSGRNMIGSGVGSDWRDCKVLYDAEDEGPILQFDERDLSKSSVVWNIKTPAG